MSVAFGLFLVVIFLFIGVILFSIYLFIRLNKYIENLESKIENTITIIENLKQSFRDILVDYTVLLDDGKMKKMPIQKEKNMIYNGVNLTERITEI